MTSSSADHTGGGRPAPAPTRFRASDADRHTTVQVLQDAVARGLLTPDEASERMAAAFAVRYLDELPPLTADLPPAPVGAQAPPTAPGWGTVAALARAQAHASLSALAADGLRSRRALTAVIALVVVLVAVVALGAAALHALVDHPYGPGAFRFHRHH